VGDHAIIMSGVTIGTGAVVGAGAIVTEDVPPFAIVAGSPARVLRMRFDADRIQQLIESRWWEYGDAAAGAASIEEALSRLKSSAVLPEHFDDV
jgi:carbonic anhydrase/acetyltransferase-like protein (isoleucine patch superfamily)